MEKHERVYPIDRFIYHSKADVRTFQGWSIVGTITRYSNHLTMLRCLTLDDTVD